MDYIIIKRKGANCNETCFGGELEEVTLLTDSEFTADIGPRKITLNSMRRRCKVCGSDEDVDDLIPLCCRCLNIAKNRDKLDF